MEGKLKLNDLLQLRKEQLSNARIRLNMSHKKEDPFEIYKADHDKLYEWNYHANKSFKNNQIIIGLIKMGPDSDKYLLFTIGTITDDTRKPIVGYDTLSVYDDLFGRVVVTYHNTVQQTFRRADKIIDELIVGEIMPTRGKPFDFPGYQNVHLNYSQLKAIVEGKYPSYENALERQKAVYVLTDTSNGKLYIGSATSQNGMLLARWKNYVKNGHGDNTGLKNIPFDHIKKYFRYSIIEHFDESFNDVYVLERESYWKKVLDSRNHGYNKN